MGNFTIRVGPASDYCSTWFFAFIHTFARIAVLVPQSDYYFFYYFAKPWMESSIQYWCVSSCSNYSFGNVGTINYPVEVAPRFIPPNEDMGYDGGKIIHSFHFDSTYRSIAHPIHCIDSILELWLSSAIPFQPNRARQRYNTGLGLWPKRQTKIVAFWHGQSSDRAHLYIFWWMCNRQSQVIANMRAPIEYNI